MASSNKSKAPSKTLATHVHVNGEVYGPDSDIPADVAEQITNPKAWGESDSSNAKG